MLLANWAVAGLFGYLLWDMVSRNHLHRIDRNHTLFISWATISLILNFALINFQQLYLVQVGGFIMVLALMVQTWQRPVAPIQCIASGAIIGVVSTYYNESLYLILLFPLLFYHMRSWSGRNCGSLVTGVLLAIWVRYCFLYFTAGEATANFVILSYADMLKDLIPSGLHYELWEWVYLGIFAFVLIIFSAIGFIQVEGNSIKADATNMMFSILTLVITVIAILDMTHLPDYIGHLSALLSIQLSLQQSCRYSSLLEWSILFILLVFAILGLLPIVMPLFV